MQDAINSIATKCDNATEAIRIMDTINEQINKKIFCDLAAYIPKKNNE